MKLSTSQQVLLSCAYNNAEMLSAIKLGEFYVEATPCINDSYCIGAFEEGNGESPALQATLSDCKEDHQNMVDEWNTQINNNERDKDDVWEGVVMKALWDGGSTIILKNGIETVYEGDWRDITGL